MSRFSIRIEENDIEKINGLKGFWIDSVDLDKFIVQRHKCPKCKHFLVYNGYANTIVYKCFGICFDCEFAKLFWTEPSVFGQVKNKILKRAKDKKAA